MPPRSRTGDRSPGVARETTEPLHSSAGLEQRSDLATRHRLRDASLPTGPSSLD